MSWVSKILSETAKGISSTLDAIFGDYTPSGNSDKQPSSPAILPVILCYGRVDKINVDSGSEWRKTSSKDLEMMRANGKLPWQWYMEFRLAEKDEQGNYMPKLHLASETFHSTVTQEQMLEFADNGAKKMNYEIVGREDLGQGQGVKLMRRTNREQRVVHHFEI